MGRFIARSIFCLMLFTTELPNAMASDSDNLTLFDLARMVSAEFGYTVVFSPRVKSSRKVDIYTDESFTGKELYQVFLMALDLHGYAAVRKNNIIRVVRDRRARSMPIPVIIDN